MKRGTTFLFLLLLLLNSCSGKNEKICSSSSCGNIHNISFPFRLNTDPKHCGDRRYTLHCQSNSTVLYLYSGKYYVQSINYSNFTIRLVDTGVSSDDCSSIPLFPLTPYNFSLQDPFTYHIFNSSPSGILSPQLSTIVTFMACSSPASSSSYVDTSPCVRSTNEKRYSYVDVGRIQVSDLMNNCSLQMMSLFPVKVYANESYFDVHRDLAFGFELSWHYLYCGECRGCYFEDINNVQCISDYFKRVCYLNFGIRCTYLIGSSSAYQMFFRITRSTPTVLVLLVLLHCAIRTLLGTPLIIGFLIYKWRRRHLSGYNKIEEFLENQNNLMPIRYSYSEIKKITEGFKDKLGQGGFGSVYKGKLRSGQAAAIKVLSNSKTNGQDFINEVATIGRIHHTNVVQLIGFCVEGSKRALVYEFMPKGSLDKYVSSKEGPAILLNWKKLHEISLGIARGVDYLHKGCEMQILHFDIKPHNILLDENFIPKVSDFGLAKLYETNNSMKSLTEARGTIGYMAPELFYRNIGNVSYKADVYSYGMLLLEMSGKRKKLNALEDNSNESSYFPKWVYDEVSKGNVDANAGENQISRQIVVVGLWCIQMKPCDRPAMSKVIEMLEADLESLELPPQPMLYPDEVENNGEPEYSCFSGSYTESSCLIENSCPDASL